MSEFNLVFQTEDIISKERPNSFPSSRTYAKDQMKTALNEPYYCQLRITQIFLQSQLPLSTASRDQVLANPIALTNLSGYQLGLGDTLLFHE